MIELPVVKASLSVTKRKPSETQSTISSASRDRWMTEIDAADRNSSAKSRSLTASIELAIGRSKPSAAAVSRSEEHTSELQSLMRISYAVFCLKKKKQKHITQKKRYK